MRIVAAAACGTLLEWYDLFLYAALLPALGPALFGSTDASVVLPLAVAGLALGFAARPVGAVLIGWIGNRSGPRRVLLVTGGLLGGSTFAVGLMPGHDSIGLLAPVLLGLLRILQGAALGGEYGAAASLVADHAGPGEVGRRTGWLPAVAPLGLLLAYAVAAVTHAVCGEALFQAWGWRLPFLASAVLAMVALRLRASISEPPAPGALASEDSTQAVRAPSRLGTLGVFVILSLVTTQAVVSSVGQLYTLLYMQQTLKVDATLAGLLLGIAMALVAPFCVLFGAVSDRAGRKKVILAGSVLAAFTYYPVFEELPRYANPALAEAQSRYPVVLVAAPGTCSSVLDRLRERASASSCDVVMDLLDHAGIRYTRADGERGALAQLRVGRLTVAAYEPRSGNASVESARFREEAHGALFRDARYPTRADPSKVDRPMTVLLLAVLMIFVTMVNGPIAAALIDLVPPGNRCLTVALAYQVPNAWLCALPLTVGFGLSTEATGFYPGLGYPTVLAAAGFVVALVLAPNTRGAIGAARRAAPRNRPR